MEPARVDLLLFVWERTVAPLRECRSALEKASWNAERALAKLDADEAKGAGPRQLGALAPNALLTKYKNLARAFHDVTPGSLPRSLVFVTEHSLERSAVLARWERHRFFLGSPNARFFSENRASAQGRRRCGSHVRIVRDLEQEPALTRREEALLSLFDVRFLIDRLAHFSRRSGMRVAVELRGTSGWVDESGADAAIESACDKLLDVDGEKIAEMKSAFAALDPKTVHAWLDRAPERRANVADCGWAAHSEAALLRTARILRDVDLAEDDVPDHRSVVSALEAAARATRVYQFAVARLLHASSGDASFVDLVDRLAIELGFTGIGAAWTEVSRDVAVATLRNSLTTSLAYRSPLERVDVVAPIDAFVGLFEDDAIFFRNGEENSYGSILGTTFEAGAAVVDSKAVGFLLVGDED